MKKPVNLTELLVEQKIEELREKRGDKLCTCETCKADIMAYALNNLPPRYVNTDKGEIYVRAQVLNSQMSTDLLVEVSKAIEYVKKNPRH
jgi:competence protein ComFB